MCAYCEGRGDRPLPDIDGGGFAFVAGWSGMLVFEPHSDDCPGYGIRIRFCPVCGRELKGGE